MAESSSEGRGDTENKGNGLLLYCYNYSYYSQKVIMALHEKKVPFKIQEVQILKGEQYEPWFLRINPKGEVPVLQDGVRVIPGSGRIIDYLEDNFTNGEKPCLVPKDVRQKVDGLRTSLDQLPAGALTMGALLHPDLCGARRFPFDLPMAVLQTRMDVNSPETLSQLAEQLPEFRDALLQKAQQQELRRVVAHDQQQFLRVLAQVEEALDQAEREMATHEPDHKDWWLCCETFSAADISLCVLLERLRNLGLVTRMLDPAKRPLLARYFTRAQLRDSYTKTMAVPATATLCAMFSHSCPVMIAGAVLLTALVTGYVLVRRN